MSESITSFVEAFPTGALQTGLALVRGSAVSKREALLAVLNIESYAMGLFVGDGDPTPMFSSAEPPTYSADEVEDAFAALMPDDSGTMKFGSNKRELFKTILAALLPLVLKLLV